MSEAEKQSKPQWPYILLQAMPFVVLYYVRQASSQTVTLVSSYMYLPAGVLQLELICMYIYMFLGSFKLR